MRLIKLFYGGAEVPSHRKLLRESGIKTVSLSYVGLSRRVKFARPWLIDDPNHFDSDQEVFLDSGAFSLNRKSEADAPEEEDVFELAQKYMAFVAENIDRVSLVSEFDATALGQDWIQGMREDFYNNLGDKFLPIWHAETGSDELQRLADRYARVGVLAVGLDDQSTRTLNSLAVGGVKLHGVSMTKVDMMRSVHWDSVGSLSWLSPLITGGDTIIWTGRELKRYPKDYKAQCRKRHRTWLAENGFNTEALEADDKDEVLRLSLWSWGKLVDDINEGRDFARDVLKETLEPYAGDVQNPELDPDGVTHHPPEPLNSELVPHRSRSLPVPRERVLLPVLSRVENPTSEDGSESRTEPVLGISSKTLMACDSCFIKDKCPQYSAGSECAFEFPAEVTTTTQKRLVFDNLIALQYQRVQRMVLFEQAEGGYADANLSSEMDRLIRMLKTRDDIGQQKFSLNVSASSSGEPGMISRIFGDAAGDAVTALPEAQALPAVAGELGMDVTEAEIVDG